MDPQRSCFCRNATSDIHKPPEYNWWTRLNLRRELDIVEKALHASAPAADTGVAEDAGKPLGLRLSTFHRTLGKNDDPVLVEKLIRAHLEQQKKRHDEANKMRKADAILRREHCRSVNSLAVQLRRIVDTHAARRGRVIKGRTTIGIFEGLRPLGGLRRFLVKRGAVVLWEGRSPGCFSSFRVEKYREGLENTSELLFYKSVLIKAMDTLPRP